MCAPRFTACSIDQSDDSSVMKYGVQISSVRARVVDVGFEGDPPLRRGDRGNHRRENLIAVRQDPIAIAARWLGVDERRGDANFGSSAPYALSTLIVCWSCASASNIDRMPKTISSETSRRW